MTPFQIMTEQQLQQADEETLRQRVRALSNLTSVFREIRETLIKNRNILLGIESNTSDYLLNCRNLLIEIANNTRKPVKRKCRKTKKIGRARKTR